LIYKILNLINAINRISTKSSIPNWTKCGDIMQKKIATIIASLLVTTAASVNAQSEKIPKYFLSDFFKGKPPNCKTLYPPPIGSLPSRTESNQVCVPPPIAIIPEYGVKYAQLMRKGIQAGIRGDYNTALINFRRAHSIEISKNYLKYSNREALRGINGALVAKRYQQNPRPSKRLTPQFFWYYWTGTGDRGNWGTNIIEQK
jgi:hypothetical protein